MMKKALIGGLFVILVAIGGIFLFIQSMGDQVRLQYDEETISSYKRELDFKPFEDGLDALSDDRREALEQMILDQNIETIQAHISQQKMTCEELVLYYVSRIKEYNDDYNAVLQLNPFALDQAKVLDQKIRNGENIGKLYGVTVLLKDNIAALDMNTSTGAYALQDLETKRDAYVVNELKLEDAIILGKANLSEWSNFMSMPSSNGFSVLGGQTKNAYGKYDVGGSSSGPSVAESLNFSTVTIGTETAGSLIYPAGQNSVVALKPTTGLISRDLIIPISEAQDTAGIIARNVKDLETVFDIAVSYDENDKKSIIVQSLDDIERQKVLDKDYLKGKRLGVVNNDSDEMEKIIQEFVDLGVEVIEIQFSEEVQNVDMMSVLLYGIKVDVNAFLKHPDVISDYESLSEIVAFNTEDPKSRMPFGQYYLEQGLDFEMTKTDYEALVEKNEKLTSVAIDDLMRQNDIEGIISISNELSGIYAPASYPAITVPSGYRSSGEPYGVTIVGSKNDDFKLIQMAYSYEQYTGHRKSPIQ